MRDYPHLMSEFQAKATQWLQDGSLKNPVTISVGLENAHEAINNVVTGRNVGKRLIQVSDDPTI